MKPTEELQAAKDAANAAHAKRYENCMDYRDEAESLKLCVADLNKAISEHVKDEKEPRKPKLSGDIMKFVLILLSFIPFSSFASDCETPDFSHFPVHVCEYLTDNYCIAKKIEHLYGIPAAVTLGVASFESGYGRSNYAKDKNNHFGNRLKSGKFRTYGTKEASFYGFAELMLKKRYRAILEGNKPASLWKWAQHLNKKGYCSSKGYDDALYKVIRFVNRQQQLTFSNHNKNFNNDNKRSNRGNRKNRIQKTRAFASSDKGQQIYYVRPKQSNGRGLQDFRRTKRKRSGFQFRHFRFRRLQTLQRYERSRKLH